MAAGGEVIIETDDAVLACEVHGSDDGPLALCLHGFPDTPHTWRHLTGDLVQAGWRVAAPYLRGFGGSKVKGAPAAGPLALGRDANALHDALGGDDRAVLIGHDWGAAAAYAASSAEPQRWARVVAASWPPLPREIDLASFEQMRRSWYVFLFQLPQARDLILDAEFIDRLWTLWAPGHDGREDAAEAARAIRAADGDLVLEHYRELFRSTQDADAGLTRPILYLHGAQDGCIGCELVEGLGEQLPPGSEVVILAGAGHFPQLEDARAFNAAVLAFVGNAQASSGTSTCST